MEDPGWDAVKKYFRKIINSFALGLLWMLTASTAGLYYRFGFVEGGLHWQTVVYYLLLALTFAGLLWYFYKIWKS